MPNDLVNNKWIEGTSLSGKSEYLVQQFLRIQQYCNEIKNNQTPSVLVFSVDAEAREKLRNRLALASDGKTCIAVTPLSFFRNEVMLFFPLLMKKLNLQSQFPILLRVENEQDLATQLWADQFDRNLKMAGVTNMRLTRRILDLFLLAAYSGRPLEDISQILKDGLGLADQELYKEIAIALNKWREYCWKNGLLTYGIITELFGRYLLPDSKYQASLKSRYQYLLMDDVDEYPAIACELALVMLNQGAKGIFTYNPNGASRLGLGADPDYWRSQVAGICEIESLAERVNSLAQSNIESILNIANDPFYIPDQDQIENFITIETRSRGSLLRTVAEVIATAIASMQIAPKDIAIIAPGLDNIASYALREILTKKDIPIICLSDQHPLSNSAQVRSLLTLFTLIYPHLGHLVTRDQVAEMLTSIDLGIDPVRAGLLSDRYFVPDTSEPKLLSSQNYSEAYRLGYETSKSYEQIRAWISQQQELRSLSPLLLLDRAIQKFLVPQKLDYEKLANLQELLETAQYYWQIGYRLGWQDRQILIGFIDLIRTGIVTANPQAPSTYQENSVTLATIYQYRMAHTQHRWQFWLDAGSPLWPQGGSAALFAAPLFLQAWQGEVLSSDYENMMNKHRLERLLQDLIYRADQKIYLCYSELNTAGQEQIGELIALKDIAVSSTVI